MSEMGKWLIVAGALMALMGAVFFLAGRVPWLGRLPGDIRIGGKGGGFYLPLATCLLLSIVLTLILNALLRVFGRH
jgi:hypothetical protein